MPQADKLVSECISNFSCARDEDLVSFLANRAVLYEQVARSRTYFIIDEEALPSFSVLGYFAISLHAICLPESLTNRQIQRLDGFSAKNRQGRKAALPAYLIGQLAKNDAFAQCITGRELLGYAFSIIKGLYRDTGGRIVAIDCRPIEKLQKFYSDNGFVQIGHNEATGLDQFVFMLNNSCIEGSEVHRKLRAFSPTSLETK